MASGVAFDPDEFAAYKAAARQLPDEFDPSDYAKFKAEQAKAGKPAAAKAETTWSDTAADVGKTILPGLARGVTGLIGFPNAALDATETYITGPVARAAIRAFGGTPASDRGLDGRTHLADNFVSADTLNKGVNAGLRRLDMPEMYKPQTVPGEFANTIAEFAPNALAGGGTVLQRLAQVAVPAVTSETAGQVTRRAAPDWEGTARLAGALGGGVGTAIAQMPRGGRATLAQAIDDLPSGSLDDAAALGERSRNLPGGGLDLSVDELLNRVTGGQATRASQVARVVANSGGEGQRLAAEFYARRPAQVDATGRALFDTLAPRLDDPTVLGDALQRAAQGGVMQTAEGQALAAARVAAGPRVTAEQAGQVIQPELARTLQGREGMRAALAEQDYGIARNAPERVGIDRMVEVERPGEPIVTYPQYSRPQFDADAPAPLGSAVRAETAPRAESMLRFLAKDGLPFDAETRAADLHKAYIPGFGAMARRSAPTWDQIRVRLMEGGFLPPDAAGYAKAEGVRDFVLDAVRRERAGGGRTLRMIDDASSDVPRRGREADEYDAALSMSGSRLDDDLRRAGVDPASLHPEVRSRTLNSMLGDPRLDALDAYERVVGSMREPPRPYSRSTTVTEQVPSPLFGQANPQPVIDHVDDALRSAKGPVALALQQARKALFDQDGRTPDMSVAGLHGAREAMNDLIAKAQPQTQRALMGVRDRLDETLSRSVPEYERARSGFEAASRPLDAFDGTAAGRIAARDPVTGRMEMAPEKAPAAIDAGVSEARAFNDVASPAARQAYEGRLTTRLLDAAADGSYGVSAERLRTVMREHEDVLAQYPAVRDNLSSIASAREGLALVERSPLGRIAERPDVAKAVKAVFPAKPLAGSEREIASTMRTLAERDPDAANQLARIYLETTFDDAVKAKRGLPAQYGGAGFASAVRGNAQVRKNLDAAFNAMPNGNIRLRALDHLLTAFETTGYRPQRGSDTAFNIRIQDELGGGRSVGGAIASAATHGAAGGGVGGLAGAASGGVLGIKKAAGDAWLRWQIGRNGGEIARLLFDPRALPELRALAKSKPGTRTSDVFLARLFTLAAGGTTSGDATADRVRQLRR